MDPVATDPMPEAPCSMLNALRREADQAGYRRRFVDFLKRHSEDLQGDMQMAGGAYWPVLWQSQARRAARQG